MKSRKKMNLILIIFVIILVLGLGYAYLTTTLSINGTTDVDANTWNVYWDNVQVTSGSVTGSQVTQAPTIDTNKTTVSFRVNLKQPGEFYEFTVDAKNTGSIDAMIDSISKTTNIPNYLKYNVTYDDDIEIETKHKLSANSTQKYKVRVEYRTDINANQLPSSSSSTTLTFGTNYIQADSNAVTKPYYVYTFDYTWTGLDLTEVTLNIYNDYTQIANTSHPFFQKHLVVDNKLTKTYFGFIYNGNVYYLPAFYSSNFNSNKTMIENIFGVENCQIVNNSYSCGVNNMLVYLLTNSSNIAGTYGSNIHVELNAMSDGVGYCQGSW